MRTIDRDKFVRLANARVNKAINAIRLVGNLSNRSNYDYTDDDVEKIFRALQAEMKTCRTRFEERSKAGGEPFRLE